VYSPGRTIYVRVRDKMVDPLCKLLYLLSVHFSALDMLTPETLIGDPLLSSSSHYFGQYRLRSTANFRISAGLLSIFGSSMTA
jgi:hypothetical protein